MRTYLNFNKLFASVIISLTTVLLVGCVDKLEEETGNIVVNKGTLPSLTAGFSDGSTKTYVEESRYLFWHEYDLISAFVGVNLNSKYEFDGNTGDNSGSFSHIETSGKFGVELERIYAVYPYNESNTVLEEGKLSVILPKRQAYATNSFGENSNVMVAVTQGTDDTFLSFKNVCGFLKLKLYSNEKSIVKTISVQGNNNEKICGASTISLYNENVPDIVMSEASETVITIDCGNGVVLGTSEETATEIWVVIPPTIFSKGISISAKDIDGKVFLKSTSNSITINRNEIQPMAVLEATFEQVGPARNEIWYTANEKVEPAEIGFCEEIVSNVFNEETGFGVITFDEALSIIGTGAFKNKTTLTGVELPDGVIQIDFEAFSGCTSLQSFVIPGSIEKINSGAFDGCTGELVVNGNLTKVGSSFKNSKFNKIIFTNAVDSIGNNVFRECTAISSITMPDNLTVIGDYAFMDCSQLVDISWSSNLKEIGTHAFYHCSSITALNLPENIEVIGGNAFNGCSLSEVYIPSSVTTLSLDGLFGACKGITKFSGNFASEDGLALVYDGHILGFANGADNLQSYSIPEGITDIPLNIFYYAPSLEMLEFPSTLKTIDDYFLGCEKLRILKLKSIEVPEVSSQLFYAYKGNDKQILVPASSLDKYKIANNWKSHSAFMCGYYDDISNVQVSDKKITYKATEKVDLYLYSGFGANFVQNNYDSSTGTGEILFDDVITSIGFRAFYNKDALMEITIPEGVEELDDYAFLGCDNLEKVSLPSTLTTLWYSVFSACKSLKDIVLPKSLTTIGNSAFESCSSLESIVVPEGVKTINYLTFSGCDMLKEVVIPSTVTSISSYAFAYSGIERLYCNGSTPPSLASNVFDGVPSEMKIYVPMANVQSYKSSSSWSTYADKIVGKLSDDTPVGYSVNLNSSLTGANKQYGWVKSSVSNPSSILYDGVYESNNWHKNGSEAIMYIDINGLTEFSFYIKGHSESDYDYVMVSQLDAPITSSTASNNESLVKATTKGDSNKGSLTTIDDYKKVTFENIDGKAHRITVIYRKDNSDYDGNDRGYVLIPKEYGSNVEQLPDKYYNVNLEPSVAGHYSWRKSTTVSNPSSSNYDGVYESTNNGVEGSRAVMSIDISGYTTFRFYIRSHSGSEAAYDYARVSNLDASLTDDSSAKMTTRYNSNSGTTLSSYTEVVYNNIDGGSHRITIEYSKDGYMSDGNDKAYVLIPKNQ